MPVGPGDRGLSPPTRLIRDFCLGTLPARMDCTLNLIDVRDVAEGLVRTMERGRPGRRYLLGGENLTLLGLLGILSELTGVAGAAAGGVPYALGLAVAYAQRGLGRPRHRPAPQGDRHRRPPDPPDDALRRVAEPGRARPDPPARSASPWPTPSTWLREPARSRPEPGGSDRIATETGTRFHTTRRTLPGLRHGKPIAPAGLTYIDLRDRGFGPDRMAPDPPRPCPRSGGEGIATDAVSAYQTPLHVFGHDKCTWASQGRSSGVSAIRDDSAGLFHDPGPII